MLSLRWLTIAFAIVVLISFIIATYRTTGSVSFFLVSNGTAEIQHLLKENNVLLEKMNEMKKDIEGLKKELSSRPVIVHQTTKPSLQLFPSSSNSTNLENSTIIEKPLVHNYESILEILPLITTKTRVPNVAMVVPFVLKQVDLLIKALYQWGHTRIKACNTQIKGDYTQHRSLVLYYDMDINAVPAVKEQIQTELNKLPWITECYSSMIFASAGLTAQESTYRYGDYKGPNNQWLKTFHLPIMQNYDYWILVEPDVVAIRDFWLDRVFEEAVFSIDDFWMKGSTNRIPWYGSFHMNGNAIYKLHDPDFQRTVLDHIASVPTQPYDLLTLSTFFGQQQKNGTHYKTIQHKWIFSDFVQDWASGAEFFPYEQILKECPNTVLVHNKKAVLEWIDGKPHS